MLSHPQYVHAAFDGSKRWTVMGPSPNIGGGSVLTVRVERSLSVESHTVRNRLHRFL
jgi:hypothetical protein